MWSCRQQFRTEVHHKACLAECESLCEICMSCVHWGEWNVPIALYIKAGRLYKPGREIFPKMLMRSNPLCILIGSVWQKRKNRYMLLGKCSGSLQWQNLLSGFRHWTQVQHTFNGCQKPSWFAESRINQVTEGNKVFSQLRCGQFNKTPLIRCVNRPVLGLTSRSKTTQAVTCWQKSQSGEGRMK